MNLYISESITPFRTIYHYSERFRSKTHRIQERKRIRKMRWLFFFIYPWGTENTCALRGRRPATECKSLAIAFPSCFSLPPTSACVHFPSLSRPSRQNRSRCQAIITLFPPLGFLITSQQTVIRRSMDINEINCGGCFSTVSFHFQNVRCLNLFLCVLCSATNDSWQNL